MVLADKKVLSDIEKLSFNFNRILNHEISKGTVNSRSFFNKKNHKEFNASDQLSRNIYNILNCTTAWETQEIQSIPNLNYLIATSVIPLELFQKKT